MRYNNCLSACLLTALASKVVAGVLRIPSDYKTSEAHNIISNTYILKCPLENIYSACHKQCSCSSGNLKCDKTAPSLCSQRSEETVLEDPCICFEVPITATTEDANEPPSAARLLHPHEEQEVTTTSPDFPWPSLLNCPMSMPSEIKAECWDKCACVKGLGEICMFNTPTECTTSCLCSEVGYIAMHAEVMEFSAQIKAEIQKALSEDPVY